MGVLIAVLASQAVSSIAGLVVVVGVIALIVQAVRRRPLRQWGVVTLGALAVAVVFGGVASALYGPTQPSQESAVSPKTDEAAKQEESEPAPPAPAPEEKAKAEPQRAESEEKEDEPKEEVDSNPNFGDGTHQVGTDIQPGTYRTKEGSRGCYYARLNGFSGELDDILANGNANGPAIITIEQTDAGFQSRRCGTWTQNLSAITESRTSFDEGAYIVNTDIEPGTYRNSGSSGCYYQRLSGFSGGLENIIANENANEPTVVTIAPTDAGFESQRCGTWTKIE